MRVLKFGGTSVATPERRDVVAGIVRDRAERGGVVVVVSALAGVTDALAAAVDQALRRETAPGLGAALAQSHAEAGGAALRERLRELRRLLDGVGLLGECPPSIRHRVLASGERLALPLMAAALGRAGLAVDAVDGSDLVATTGADGDGPEVDLEATRRRVLSRPPAHGPGAVTLVAGFVAGDRDGRTTTLGRGASDLTATVLARALDASAVEIWSDVDGVLSAPPRWVPSARPLARIAYGEAAALAHFGARVLHPRTLEPVAAAGIPVWIRNTLRPAAPGTRIDAATGGAEVKAVTAVDDACRLVVRAPWTVPGVTGRVAAALERLGTRPLLIQRDAAAEGLALLVRRGDADRLERELADVEVARQDGLAAVAAVGAAPWRRAGEALRLLDDAGVELLGLSTAGREPALVAVVEAGAAVRAVESLHRGLIGPRRHRPRQRERRKAILQMV